MDAEQLDDVLSKSRKEIIEYVYDQFGEQIKRVIFTYVKNHAQTDDIFQEFLITVYHKINTYKGKSKFETWLYRIAVNKCKDYLRSPIHRLFKHNEQLEESRIDLSPENKVYLAEIEIDIVEAILSLPVKYREVIVLRFYKTFSIKEISETLKVKESTVKTRLSRGKKKIQLILGGDYIEK
ncbi:RNA polymerase sigma factor [Virgibacillus sp. MSP4-1]|uniref:RNA polymerase sigma factor n=1 Tax=Virgibacillus sp. MSP4-1 TaxID=2700081 RepID=UPI0003A0BEBE|nr:sigma-70 family RNA polymerase sigma factor [Virgibacillus sp. MSP4-1]